MEAETLSCIPWQISLIAQPVIEILPMAPRSEIKSREEDWTGKSSTAVRRKLQNRLNQRASRRRRGLTDASTKITPRANSHETDEEASPQVLQLSRISPSQGICIHPTQRQSVTAAANFQYYMRTPLPADQKLLTLLHFNLVRALTQNVFLLGIDPDTMNDDIPSPFAASASNLQVANLPPALYPTYLQRTIAHHPEIDVFPFPMYRDNLIRAGSTIDDTEFCLDVLYGVELDADLNTVSREPVKDSNDIGLGDGGRTGLIVWSDPWLQSSWEVEEGFARKYKRLLKGCDQLIWSTNFWRRQRGEKALVIELED